MSGFSHGAVTLDEREVEASARRDVAEERPRVHTVGMTDLSPDVARLIVQVGDLAGAASRPIRLEDELRAATARIRQLFDAAACSVALIDAGGASLTFRAADGAGAGAIVGVSLPLSRGIVGWVALTGQGIAVGDVTKDSRYADDVAAMTDYAPEAIFAVPLETEARGVVGVMEVLDPRYAASDTAQALNVLGTVAGQLAAIVTLAGAYDALGRSLLEAAVGASDAEGFASALDELAGRPDESSARLAASFLRLSQSGPEAADLAAQILESVVAYVRAAR
jgi:GAF domain-containing protein